MNSASATAIHISDIDISNRLQPLNEARAEELRSVIEVHGFILPKIALRRITNGAHGWVLVHGRHRLRALEILGLSEIVEGEHFERLDVSPGEARLIEIEENMARTNTTPFARAIMLKAYRDALVDDGLKFGRGGDRKSKEYQRGKRAPLISIEASFTAHAAEIFDLSADQVKRLLRVATKLGRWKGADGKMFGPEGLAERLYFSSIGRNRSQLLKLAALTSEQLQNAALLHEMAGGEFDVLYAALSMDVRQQEALMKMATDGRPLAACVTALSDGTVKPSEAERIGGIVRNNFNKLSIEDRFAALDTIGVLDVLTDMQKTALRSRWADK